MTALTDHEFAVCLTHDVDRVSKTFQVPYDALVDRDPGRLRQLCSRERPYWQFEEIMALEDDLGVRSSFYFLHEKDLLREKRPREWFRPVNWKLFTGRYDVTDDEVTDVIRRLDRGGWEVGLHGSYESYDDRARLRYEKATLEDVLGGEVHGVRQHYLRLERPTTWEIHRDLGLRYDASLGSTATYGFQHGHGVLRPFDDEFVVLPLTAMEVALTAGADAETALERGLALLREACREGGVVTLLWHPRYFNEEEFPGYRSLYVDLVAAAKEMGAWIGPCRDFLSLLE